MTTKRWFLAASAAVAAATVMCVTTNVGASTPRPTRGAAPTLDASPAKVRVGDTITVAGTACPTPSTVIAVDMQTLPADFTKGLPPFMTVDLPSLGVVQTASGVSFHVVAAEGRTSLNFKVFCSDTTETATTTAVMVYPPVGEFWWIHNVYDKFETSPGQVFPLAVRTLDCDAGSTATATLTSPDHRFSMQQHATVGDDTTIEFDMQMPATMTNGTYVATVACNAGAARYTHSTPVLVFGGTIPATGGQPAAAWLALALLLTGAALAALARRRTPARPRL
jgi:hypothetical protein